MKKDVTTEDVEYEKNKSECTFKPKIGEPFKKAIKTLKPEEDDQEPKTASSARVSSANIRGRDT